MARNPLVALINDVNEIKRRLSVMGRHGVVAEVNPAEGWVRLNLGDGDNGPLLSPKLPYAQMAGALKLHAPPTVGQNMTLFAPTGDIRQAIAMPMTWSDANPTPGQSADPVFTYGDITITIEPGAILIGIGGTAWRITPAGLSQTGGMIRHNEKDIGSTHRHGGVLTGGAATNPPV